MMFSVMENLFNRGNTITVSAVDVQIGPTELFSLWYLPLTYLFASLRECNFPVYSLSNPNCLVV